MRSFKLTFITPLFSKGAYEDKPEIRASSIRGQLRWWFRALGGSSSDESRIFGAISSKQANRAQTLASKVVVRVSDIEGKPDFFPTLPHKYGGASAPKYAFSPSTSCFVHVLERLGGLNSNERKLFDKALQAWLLLGSLGLRSTRAGGNFNWESVSTDIFSPPINSSDYNETISGLLNGTPIKARLLLQSYTNAEDARFDISDTIGGRNDNRGDSSLRLVRYPLGNFKPRKTSPLRFRIVQFNDGFRIVAIWDGRNNITGNREGDLNEAVKLLKGANKKIGVLMSDASFG